MRESLYAIVRTAGNKTAEEDDPLVRSLENFIYFIFII
jgi:hypothetical protein